MSAYRINAPTTFTRYVTAPWMPHASVAVSVMSAVWPAVAPAWSRTEIDRERELAEPEIRTSEVCTTAVLLLEAVIVMGSWPPVSMAVDTGWKVVVPTVMFMLGSAEITGAAANRHNTERVRLAWTGEAERHGSTRR